MQTDQELQISFNQYLTSVNIDKLSDKQIKCIIFVVDKIIKKSNFVTNYEKMADSNKKNFILYNLKLSSDLWQYILNNLMRYEKLYAFT